MTWKQFVSCACARKRRDATRLPKNWQPILIGFLTVNPCTRGPSGCLSEFTVGGLRNKSATAALSGLSLLILIIVLGSVSAAAHFRKMHWDQQVLANQMSLLADQKGKLVVEKESQREKAVLAEQPRSSALRRQSEDQGAQLRRTLYLAEMNLAGQAATVSSGLGRVNELLGRWADEIPDVRNWEWYYLNGLLHRSLQTRMTHAKSVHQLAFSPDGSRFASAGADAAVSLWQTSEESPPLRLTGHKREVFGVAWSPHGERLVSASWDGTVRVWNTKTDTKRFG